MKTPVVETKRLILREVRLEDVDEIFNCWMQDEEVSKYIWWKANNDITEVESWG